MSNIRAILILEQGREKFIIPGVEMYKVLPGRGARVLDLMKTPSGHLALKADGCEMAAEDVVYYRGQSSARRSSITRQGGIRSRAKGRDTCCE
eukprot:8491946-Pyramimonas_sp.AAC.1